jgi:hypothetical protein
MSDGKAKRRSLPPDDRKLLVASLGVLVAVFALVSSNVAANHSPKPHDLPIGIVGTSAVADAARAELAQAEPGAFAVHAYRSVTRGPQCFTVRSTARSSPSHRRSCWWPARPVPPFPRCCKEPSRGRPADRLGLWWSTIWCPCPGAGRRGDLPGLQLPHRRGPCRRVLPRAAQAHPRLGNRRPGTLARTAPNR